MGKMLRRGIMPVLAFAALSLLIFTLSRAGLCIWKFPSAQGHLGYIFLQGLRTDFSIVCSMYAPAALFVLICALCRGMAKPCKYLLSAYLALVLTVNFVVEFATPPFILEYGIRPNHLFVDYLIYPKEVASTLLGGHLFATVFSVLLGLACFVLGFKLSLRLLKHWECGSLKGAFVSLALAMIIIPLGIRSTLGHRPLNPSMLSFSTSPLANSLPVNSSFNVFYALRHYGENDLSEGQIYAFESEADVLKAMRALSARTEPAVFDAKCPVKQGIAPAVIPQSRRNVVIILEESMGSDFVGSLGGLPLTPELEKLSKEGWWFENMIAAGHRSVRGIEAVTAGFPPSPLASQVKLDHAAAMATLMQIYKDLGYRTSFIYGGESHFDNMRTYFLYNGTDEITEQKDYKNPSFVASWGVSDEDLFARANEKFTKWHEQGVPFMSVVFSSSFHDPFDIPEGKVDIGGIQTDEPKRLAAVKYADYALGRFFEAAKQEPYYKDTLFVVIADHESRVESDHELPLKEFLIPALIISPEVTPRSDKRTVNQIDIAPTVLSLTGVSGSFPFVGQDLTRADAKERALLVYHDEFGYLEGKRFAQLEPNRKSQMFKAEGNRKITPAKDDPQFVSFASALENLGLYIFKNRWNDQSCVKELRQQP